MKNLAVPTHTPADTQRPWLTYRTVWRWHFYAGLFSIPFILWLSITGSIYLFRPQIERWLDRPYDSLTLTGPPATPETQAMAAINAVRGSTLHYYELPRTAHSATRVIVGRGINEYRVYLNPQSLQVLKIVSEDRRPMRIVFRLHGELMAGDWGSRLVELAASWAIVLIVTGLYLWWPRHVENLAGVLYVRLGKGKRIFWRDLHAVTGVWVSVFALFLLFTGLPWAKGWGDYLKFARSLGGHHELRQDWAIGRSGEIDNRLAMNAGSMAAMSMAHADHIAHSMDGPVTAHMYAPLNRLVPVAARAGLEAPALLMPPMASATMWTAKSDTQDRPHRAVITLDPASGAIVARENFRQRPLVDRAVGIGVAAHEGQLFGWPNQLLGLLTACGLILLSISAVVMWWRRRHVGLLGAPPAIEKQPFSWKLAALIAGFAVYLPMLGLSLAFVLLLERVVLRRMPAAQQWLGLQP